MLPGGRQVSSHLVQGEIDRGEKLRRLIMKGMGDSFYFLLQCLIQVTGRDVGFSEPAVNHFKWRQALSKKNGPCTEHQLSLFRRRVPRQTCGQRLVIHGCHVQHAQPTGQCSASQLIRLLQGGFSHPCNRIAQRGRILVLQLLHGLPHGELILGSVQRARERRLCPCCTRPESGRRSAAVDRSRLPHRQSCCGCRPLRESTYLPASWE